MKIIKRNGTEQEFDINKIRRVVNKANSSVSGDMRIKQSDFEPMIQDIYDSLCNFSTVSVETIQDKVESILMKYGYYEISKQYILYRENKKNQKKFTESEEKIMSLTHGSNEDVKQDNANKNPTLLSTQRDYIAGTMCKAIGKKILPKDITEAHEKGAIHFHDMDYSPVMQMTNCCLVNLKDMFEHGFVLNSVAIEEPKSFRTAANLASQIALHVSSSQYGGQTMSWAHIAKYVDVSRKKIIEQTREELQGVGYTEDQFNSIVEAKVKREIRDGVQTFQYQVVSMSGSNGQSPFISMSLNFDECENEQHRNDMALVIEEVLNQRIAGFKDRNGINVAPLFPKLLYFLDESNAKPGSKYYYLTQLAVKCVSIRMAPDFISTKVQKKLKGIEHSYPCMGCRSFLTTEGKYTDWDGKEKSAAENFYGRNNNGVVTINLPYVALESRGNIDEFWKILEDRLELCYRALVERYKALKGTRAKVAPILWMYGGLARKNAEDPIDDLITGFRCTYSLGYAGLWETVYYMTGKTLIENKDFALDILKFFKKKHEEWHTRLMDNNNPNSFLNTSTYGTPEEQTTTKFANALKTQFGYVEGVTDHDYVTNSYHINPAQPIDAFSKISFESEFQGLSTGGAISYVELPNMDNNLEALEEVVEYMYDTILYAECNVKRDTCAVCGYNGVISLIKENGKYLWECPNCRNRDTNKMSILRRICGYIGDASTGTSQGRLADIADRVLHL